MKWRARGLIVQTSRRSGHAVTLADHKGGLTLPSFVLLLPQSEPPADGAGSQQAQPCRKQHQSKQGDGGPVGVEGVSHRRHHDAGDEDKHAKRHHAAVAGHLRAAGRRRQLDLVDVWDTCCHDDSTVLPGLLPAQPLCRDGRRDPHGVPRDPSAPFGVEVVRHGDLTGEEQVSHDGGCQRSAN